MRRPLTAALVACLVAGCQAAPATTAGPAAPARAKATPAPAAGETPRAAAPLAPAATLRAPAGATVKLAGEVTLNARYAVNQGGGKLVGTDGASLVGLDGASLVGTDGASMVNARGQIVAAGAGNVVVPATLVGTDGASLVGTDGASLVGTDGASYRLAQAAAAQPAFADRARAAGMWVSVVDTRTGLTVPLGVDDAGKPVYTVYTNAQGRFEAFLDPALAGHTRVVARAPGRLDPKLVLNVAAQADAGVQAIDEDAAIVDGFIRLVVAQRLSAAATAETSTLQAVMPRTAAALDDPRVRALSPEAREALALALADRVLDDIAFDALAVRPAERTLLDPAHSVVGQNAKGVITRVFKRLAAVIAETSRGVPDPEAYFASLPFVRAASLHRPDRPYRIRKPGDVVDLLIREYLVTGERERSDLSFGILTDLGLAPTEQDDVVAAYGTLQSTLLLYFGAGGMLPDALDLDGDASLAAMVKDLTPCFERLPAPSPDPQPLATPPALPAYEAEVVAGLAGPERGPGQRDGVGTAAYFTGAGALALDEASDPPRLYLSETTRAALRRIVLDPAGARVDTPVGVSNAPGHVDGAGDVARLDGPAGLALTPDGKTLYMAETANHRVRAIDFAADGTATVRTVAGTGQKGAADGPAAAATFNTPYNLGLTPGGDLLVTTFETFKLRKIALNAPGSPVSTVLGDGVVGTALGPLDGPTRVRGPVAVATAPDGRVFVADQHTGFATFAWIDTLGAGGRIRSLAGGPPQGERQDGLYTDGWIKQITGVAYAARGTVDPDRAGLVVADFGTDRVCFVGEDGWIGTLASGGAIAEPFAVAVARDGTIYVSNNRDANVLRLRRKP